MQLAIWPNGQQPGVLGVFFENIGQEIGACRLVYATHQRHPSETKEQLSSATDPIIQVTCDSFSPDGELVARLGYGVSPICQQYPEYGQNWQQ